MNILFLTSSFPRNRFDFHGHFVFRLAQELKKAGHNLAVLAPHAPKTKKKEDWNGIRINRFTYFFPYSLQKVAYRSGIGPNLKKSILARVQFPLFIVSQFIYLLLEIIRFKPKIIIAHWLFPQGFNAVIAALLFKKKTFLVLHGAALFALKRMPAGHLLAKFIIRHSYKVITVSQYLKKELDSLIGYNSAASVIPMGTDTDLFFPGSRTKSRKKLNLPLKVPLILFVGRLIDVKGPQYLIKAFKYVQTSLPRAQLLIIGTGNKRECLEQQTKKLGLQDHIHFLGRINPKKLPDYYRSVNLLVCPSVPTPLGEEAFGLTSVEAQACGIPVCVSRSGGLPENLPGGNSSSIFPPAKSRPMAKVIMNMLKNRSIKKKDIRLSALRFSWSVVRQKYLNLINKLEKSNHAK